MLALFSDQVPNRSTALETVESNPVPTAGAVCGTTWLYDEVPAPPAVAAPATPVPPPTID